MLYGLLTFGLFVFSRCSEPAFAEEAAPQCNPDETHDGEKCVIKVVHYTDEWTMAKATLLEMEPADLMTKEKTFKSDKFILDWHFSMVNDYKRNDAYKMAIDRIVNKDSIVLDIGTGGGLLSLLAAKAGAKKVYTVEFEKPLVETSREIFRANGFDPRVVIDGTNTTTSDVEPIILQFHNISSNLTIPEDIPQRANVLVSEIVDSLLIGEWMLPAYAHALEHLITPDAIVIPTLGFITVVAIESEEVRREIQLPDDGQVEGFDYSLLNELSYSAHRGNCTSARLNTYRTMSLEHQLSSFDFRDKTSMGKKRPAFSEIHIEIIAPGKLDALLAWFDMYLADDIVISTHPDLGWAHENHWMQYIFKFHPLEVEAGDVVEFLVAEHQNFYQLDVLRINRDGVKIPQYPRGVRATKVQVANQK